MDDTTETIDETNDHLREQEQHDAHRAALTKRISRDRPRGLNALAGDSSAERRGITWMRISDAVAAGSGKLAGRGFDLETTIARRLRTAPAITRRTIAERSHHLPPVTAFGRRWDRTSTVRDSTARS